MSYLDHIRLVSGDPEFVAGWARICREMHEKEVAWIAGLRAEGVRASHPDDGWVNREQNTVALVYPQFNDGVEVGSVLALGWHDKHRLVRVTGRVESFGSSRWAFEAVTP